ncbi:hypothetical protein OTK49_21260 [Vibrio coralliirubri]|uniref:hypothetical protein n=1 Tax=Vibrio coralliirubri TaxID=1516159 RepID=UPI002283D902|nr:hypothetical protein [Vibrio coralliirubri]MCY9865050.1 hypothetical protein [Vibrio coralliirubri]
MNTLSIINKTKAVLIEAMVILSAATVISLVLAKGIVVMTDNAVLSGQEFSEIKMLIGKANNHLAKMDEEKLTL